MASRCRCAATRWSRFAATPTRSSVAAFSARQQELVALSAYGRQIKAASSGYLPQITDPEIVVRAIREIVALENGPPVEADRSQRSPR